MGHVAIDVDVVDPVTATFAVTLNAASCTVALPVPPTVVQARCVGGVVTEASVTLPPDGGGISYCDEAVGAGGW